MSESEVVISCQNISKQYRLGVLGTSTIAQDLNRWWAKMRGMEDPFIKVGTENKLDTVSGDFVWALRDIDMEVRRGEVLGIIGKNGAGKSTLLKLFSRVTTPTTGQIKIKGRVASLLEVGTGFHPELTGRENVFLNGAILGMSKSEIRKKFDEIIAFSGVGKYIDTPVKRYSSGMYVRLAFAVAAHLEPDILIIDEVLAVGDFEFQKKCLGKIQDVNRGGRTVLFVSHNMGAVNNLCSRAVLLVRGGLVNSGRPGVITSAYLKGQTDSDNEFVMDFNKEVPAVKDNIANLTGVKIKNSNGELFDIISVRDSLYIEMEYEIKKEGFKPMPQVNLVSMKGELVFVGNCPVKTDFTKGMYRAVMRIPADFLNTGGYYFQFNLATMNPYKDHFRIEGMPINVLEDLESPTKAGYTQTEIPGIIRPLLEWSNERITE
jgi:lipopolysaccharide transport system ATP-binding protein